jgi:hypothetical protein
VSVKWIIVAVTMAGLVIVLSPPVPAQAQTPFTCLAEVDGARFDDLPDFAGRVRPVSGDDGTIVSRSLSCPYVDADGRRTELVLAWDEQPLGRFLCENTTLVVEDGEPARARLDHPERQAVVTLEGPDVAAVQAMEEAAELNLAAVPESAAPCTAGAGASIGSPAGPGRWWPMAAALGGLVAVMAIVLVLRRRRIADRPPLTTPPLGPEAASCRLADHLVAAARRRPLDALAAAAVIAHERGRDDLAGLAVGARQSVPTRVDDPTSPSGAPLAGRILQAAGVRADGTSTTGDAPGPGEGA